MNPSPKHVSLVLGGPPADYFLEPWFSDLRLVVHRDVLALFVYRDIFALICAS